MSTSFSERLQTLHSERGHLVANYENLCQTSVDEGREFNDAEMASLTSVKERIEGVDRQIRQWENEEQFLAKHASSPAPTNILPGDRPGVSYHVPTVPAQARQAPPRLEYKGQDFTRWAIAMCVAGPWNAVEYARQRWQDDGLCEVIQRHLMMTRGPTPPMMSQEPVGPPGGGNYLARIEQLGSEFIEMLRPKPIVGQMPSMRRLQFSGAGTLAIPKQTSGVTGGYVGEGNLITVQRLSFGQMTLVPSKLAVIVPMTTELMQRSDPGIEQLVRDDMIAGTAQAIDTVWFSGAPAGAAPAGVLWGVPHNVAGNLPAAATVAQVTTALQAMVMQLRMSNVPMTAPVWIMHSRTKEYLRLMRTTQDIFAFKAEIDAGTLLGYPIVDSTGIPIPYPPGTGVETVYALVDAAQFIWAEDMLPVIDASEHATIISADPPPVAGSPPSLPDFPQYSAFQNDMVFMRIRMRHTWGRRYDEAVTWALTAV